MIRETKDGWFLGGDCWTAEVYYRDGYLAAWHVRITDVMAGTFTSFAVFPDQKEVEPRIVAL